MPRIALQSETDWDGWRAATRALVLAGVAPDEVQWRVAADASHKLPEASGSFSISRALVAMAGQAIQARDPRRFELLYRVVWRTHHGERVPDTDPGLRHAQGLALAVRAEQHRMRAQLRYLPIDERGGTRYVGWYAPAHFVLESNAPLLARRFSQFSVSILTPDGSAHWDADGLHYGPGVDPASVPDDAGLHAYWRSYGDELLEATSPAGSVPEAEALGDEPWPPDRPALGPVVMPAGSDRGIESASREAADCRRCPLHEPATQTVFGEGPVGARLMFIGEAPGDQEDVIGRPFVGPAGQLLDRALLEAGLDRRAAYITNAVKHFKFVPRGKRRLHQTPQAPEIEACRFWLDVERVQLRPALIVLLGATAARAVLGRPVTIGRERGRPIRLSDTETAFVTVHPSFLLRVPDEEARQREYQAFVRDLRQIAVAANRL